MIRLDIPVLTECKPDKPEHDQDRSSNYHPMRILHRGEHCLFTPSDATGSRQRVSLLGDTEPDESEPFARDVLI
jgi:hypothetical protein